MGRHPCTNRHADLGLRMLKSFCHIVWSLATAGTSVDGLPHINAVHAGSFHMHLSPIGQARQSAHGLIAICREGATLSGRLCAGKIMDAVPQLAST